MALSATKILRRPTAIFLNSSRLNYDGKMDYSRLHSLTNFICNDVDNMANKDEIISLVQKHQPEIIITKEMELPVDALNAFPRCVKLLCEAGTGYNNIPIQLAREKGIDVANIPTYSNESVAHMVITYIMAFSAQLFNQARMLHNNDRRNFSVFQHPIFEITNKTLGLIGGSGTIGTAVTDVAIPLGMNVLISSRSGKLPSGHKYENHPKVKVVPFDEVFKQSDFLSINCPLNSETRHSIGEREIRLMKPTAFLINTARGAIIHEAELIKCMKEKVIAGAGLDTQEVEPPPDTSEIWNLENVFMTPHIGWRRLETRQRLVDMTSDNIESYIHHRKQNIVN
jgi:glycerate dehydrogenase